jgi:hypothetical protein
LREFGSAFRFLPGEFGDYGFAGKDLLGEGAGALVQFDIVG